MAIIARLGDIGGERSWNREKFKKLEGTKLFEIKSFQIRILCFWSSDRRLVLLDGVVKQKDRHRKADLNRAEAYRQYYLDREGK